MKILNHVISILILLFNDKLITRTKTIKDAQSQTLDEIWPWSRLPINNSTTTFHCSQPYQTWPRPRIFTNCTSLTQKYPAAHVTCRCATMTSKQANLTCHAGKWYPDQPGACGRRCTATSIPSNVICENVPEQALYQAHLNCNCRNNCLSAPLWCGQQGNWSHYAGDHHCNQKFGEESKDGVLIRVNDNSVMMSCSGSQHIHESKCVEGRIMDPMPQCLTAGTMDDIEFTSSTIIVITLSTFLIICITIIVVMLTLWYSKTGSCCYGNGEPHIEATEMSNRPMTTVNKYSPSPHVRRTNDNQPNSSKFKILGDQDVKNFNQKENQSVKPENMFVFKGKELGIRYKKFKNEDKTENFDNSRQFEQPEYQNFSKKDDEPESPTYQNLSADANTNDYQNASALVYAQEEEEINTQEYANARQVFMISKGNVYDKPSTSSDYDRPNPAKDPYRYDFPKYKKEQETQRDNVESNIYDDPDFDLYDDVIPNRQRY